MPYVRVWPHAAYGQRSGGFTAEIWAENEHGRWLTVWRCEHQYRHGTDEALACARSAMAADPTIPQETPR